MYLLTLIATLCIVLVHIFYFLRNYEFENGFFITLCCAPLLAVSNWTGTHAFIRSNVQLWGRRRNVLRGVLVGNKHAIILLPTIPPSQEYTGNTRNCLWMHRIADVKTGGNDINDSCGTYAHPPAVPCENDFNQTVINSPALPAGYIVWNGWIRNDGSKLLESSKSVSIMDLDQTRNLCVALKLLCVRPFWIKPYGVFAHPSLRLQLWWDWRFGVWLCYFWGIWGACVSGQ